MRTNQLFCTLSRDHLGSFVISEKVLYLRNIIYLRKVVFLGKVLYPTKALLGTLQN